MKTIETQRLIIKPLSYNELKQYFQQPNELTENSGLQPLASLMDKEVSEAILNDLLPNLSDSNRNPLFYTIWIMIEKQENAIVGSFCFHGEPDENGEVEIGYGTEENFRNNGYMTEAIAGIIQWAKSCELIKSVKAETEKTNISSVRVLEKNKFEIIGSSDNLLVMNVFTNTI